MLKIYVGDVVRLKKQHPCGSNIWEITRTGIDIGLKCRGCGHRVMIPRTKFERACKQVIESAQDVARVPETRKPETARHQPEPQQRESPRHQAGKNPEGTVG